MNDNNKKKIWRLIQQHGDQIKNKLKPHPMHPKGRNPYAHICFLINQKFSCSYKDVCDSEVQKLKKFILSINK